MIRPDGYFAVPTRAIAVEQTHNRGGGGVIPLATLRELRGGRRRRRRRRCTATAPGSGTRTSPTACRWPTYGALFDTLSVCLSKGLGAPVGSLVVGSAEQIERARLIRKRMGGGMRQAGILAAAGRYALAHHIDRLADDHARAPPAGRGARAVRRGRRRQVRTNLVLLDLTQAALDAPALAAAARAEGVLISVLGPRTARLVTHLDLDDAGHRPRPGSPTPILAAA